LVTGKSFLLNISSIATVAVPKRSSIMFPDEKPASIDICVAIKPVPHTIAVTKSAAIAAGFLFFISCIFVTSLS
jgi:hypothetical protein